MHDIYWEDSVHKKTCRTDRMSLILPAKTLPIVCKCFAKLAVLPKNAAKVTLLCQIGTSQIVH